MWTKEALHQLIEEQMRGMRFIVVSNREPYVHRHTGKRVECIRPASGMATALDPIMRASGGVWVAHGGGDADRETVDRYDRVAVPPEDPAYSLRRVWLPAELEHDYYYGLANEGLWPLCHVVFQRPHFNLRHWESYRQVNELFAEAVLEEAAGDPAFVFIQDYHFALLPRILKRRNPALIVAQFWHIPWPNRETFSTFPWGEELLDGMLGNDLLGFHLRYHCANFLNTVDRHMEALADYEQFQITRGGHVTTVRPFPISIDFQRHAAAAATPVVAREMDRWRRELSLATEFLGIGIDRIDYTKGIPDRLHGLDLFFERHPEYLGRLSFVQIGVPSRVRIAHYRVLNEQLDRQVAAVNRRWGSRRWRPVLLLKGDFPQHRLMALHRMADFCVVSSLHDGMNLVSKEFIASRADGGGALILSQFTGAAREFPEALQVNPFAPDQIAGAIFAALEMSPAERRRRIERMRATVAENNIYRWGGKLLSALLKLDVREVEERPAGAAV